MPTSDQIRTSLERADTRRILDTALALERLTLILEGDAKKVASDAANRLKAYVADRLLDPREEAE
jgi:hypothetical protein